MSVCTSTFQFSYTGTTTTNTFETELDYYPPESISGENVFLTMKNAVVDVTSVQTPITTQIPFKIEIVNLGQPCGTFTKEDEACEPSHIVGYLVTNQATVPGARILTFIPDGHQIIRFRITQVGSNSNIQSGMTFHVMLQLEVSTI